MPLARGSIIWDAFSFGVVCLRIIMGEKDFRNLAGRKHFSRLLNFKSLEQILGRCDEVAFLAACFDTELDDWVVVFQRLTALIAECTFYPIFSFEKEIWRNVHEDGVKTVKLKYIDEDFEG